MRAAREPRRSVRLYNTYASHSPEKVCVLAFVDSQYLTMRSDHLHLQHQVGSKAVLRRQGTVAGTEDESAEGYRPRHAADHCTVNLGRLLISFQHLGARQGGDSMPFNGRVATCQLELLFVHRKAAHVVDPDGERIRRCRPADEVMTAVLDDEADVAGTREVDAGLDVLGRRGVDDIDGVPGAGAVEVLGKRNAAIVGPVVPLDADRILRMEGIVGPGSLGNGALGRVIVGHIGEAHAARRLHPQ